MRRLILFIISSALLLSCQSTSFLEDSFVDLVSPKQEFLLESDNSFKCSFPEALQIFQMQVVNDTLLVLNTNAITNPYYFQVYSLNTYDYLGGIVRKGRGPDEFIDARIASVCPDNKTLAFNVNSAKRAYTVNVEESLRQGKSVILDEFILPNGNVSWLPLASQKQFILQCTQNLSYKVLSEKGNQLAVFPFLPEYSANSNLIFTSGMAVSNLRTGQIAQTLILFPQIFIFDVVREKLNTIAVSTVSKNWKSIFRTMPGLNSTEYYTCAASSSDYIFACYKSKAMADQSSGRSIHVFDWDGKFLMDMKVDENISSMTYDRLNKRLYCFDSATSQVVRYNLHELL